MKTDYKFWYITRDDDGYITEAAIRFYEGDVTTEDERDTDGNLNSVTRYRRSARLAKSDMPHMSNKPVKTELNGSEAIVYTQDDFGVISTDAELCSFLNGEIANDANRTPVDDQGGNEQ